MKRSYVQTLSPIETTNYSSQDYNLPPFPRLGEKNKTDTTVFHFLVKSNLLGKFEISEVLGTLIYMYLNTMRLLEHERRFRRIKSSLK